MSDNRPIFPFYQYCQFCGGVPVENQDTGECASCGASRRKAERQASKVKVVAPVKKVSAKRASQTKEYLKLRREYMETHPCCEVVECHARSKELHHMGGRENELLLNTDLFLAVCVEHHHKITTDSKWALENGYSVLRTVTTPTQTI
jgi:hypothetical protein